MNSEKILKDYILTKYKSVRAFALEAGIPYSTVANVLTRGLGKASVNTVIDICSFLGIDTEDLHYGKLKKKTKSILESKDLSSNEQAIIKKYRALDEHGKKVVDTFLDMEFNRPTLIEKTEPSVREMKVFLQPAAAGLGNYLDDINYELIEFPANEIPLKTTFGIRITGDSMEPNIKDKSIVWVQSIAQIQNNEIGIFILNGEALCKKIHVEYDKKIIKLVSLNSKYKDRIIKEYDDLRTVGKVLI